MMHGSGIIGLLVAFAAMGLPACSPRPVSLSIGNVAAAVDYSRLGTVLQEAVDEEGRIRPDALKEQADVLEEQLRLLAATGPTATPERFAGPDARLAYWYNARAAWAMKLALACGCPERVSRAELSDRPFPLDGRRQMTLARIDAVLKCWADWRVAVCAPGVSRLRAPLPAKPFTPEDVRRRIGRRLNRFVDSRKRFVIDIESRTLRVPPVLWQFRGRLIRWYERTYGTDAATLRTALAAHVTGSARRRLRDAIGYRSVRAGRTGLLALPEKWPDAPLVPP